MRHFPCSALNSLWEFPAFFPLCSSFLQKVEVGTRGKNKIADFQTSLQYAKNGWLKCSPKEQKVGQDALNFS